MPEYRPCIVIETIYPSVGTQGVIESKKHNAMFHCWTERNRFYQQPFLGIYTQPNFMNPTVAIVEYEDGTIHECLPKEIQFMDGKSEKISKNKKEDWNNITDSYDSYPDAHEHVLFKTQNGKIYYGYFDYLSDEWKVELENKKKYRIKDAIEWRRI